MSIFQDTKSICKQYDIKPTKLKGQNFLINEDVYSKIIEASNLSKNDIILEVGPGLGVLTRMLLAKAKKVISVELDDKIYSYLSITKELEKLDSLELHHENILDFKINEIIKEDYKIVANLPYNITSIFLRKILSLEKKPNEMVLMLQKEVAQRITAKAGEMSLLAVSVQFYADTQIVENVKKEDFWPVPAVDSAIIKITPKKESRILSVSEKDFFRIVKIGFSAKRKKLVKNLANGLHKKPADILPILQKLNFNDNIRAQELSVQDWIKVSEDLLGKNN